MKITSPSEDRIIVDLSPQDMTELEITYEALDYSAIETRRVIWTLLDAAGKKLGRDIDPTKRMIIEAMPRRNGGCTLVFTVIEGLCGDRKPLLKKLSENLVCEFGNLDDLYRAAQSVTAKGKKTESSLYSNGGKYILLLNSPLEPDILRCRLNEFGRCEICEKLEADYIKEHWQLLASGNALELLISSGNSAKQAL